MVIPEVKGKLEFFLIHLVWKSLLRSCLEMRDSQKQ